VERDVPHGKFSIKLRLTGGQSIVTPALEPVIGWIGGERACDAQPLMFPASLLEASVTTSAVYACNLPAPRDGDENQALASLPPDPCGALPGKIEGNFEAAFLKASLPGGQAGVISRQGERDTVKFRWICVTANASIGAVWRCFAQMGAPRAPGLWNAIAHDYVFEAGSGSLLNPPGDLKIALADGASHRIDLSHPDGMLTCFSCPSGRVKITRLSTSGWAKRDLLSLLLYPDRSIVARFSDGTQKAMATAAPALSSSALAA
jgi:hypothetical protein